MNLSATPRLSNFFSISYIYIHNLIFTTPPFLSSEAIIKDTFQQWRLFQDFTETQIQNVLDKTDQRTFNTGEYICTQGEIGESLFIIHSGRVNMRVTKSNGVEKNLNVLKEGDHFGELALLSGGARTASAIALSDVVILEVAKDDFLELLKEIPALSINLSRTIGSWLQGELKGDTVRNKLCIIALVHSCRITANFAVQVVEFFANKNKKIAVFSGRQNLWEDIGVPAAAIEIDAIESTQQYMIKASEAVDHVFIDISHQDLESIPLLSQCDRIWCFIEQSKGAENTFAKAMELLDYQTRILHKTQWVWAQEKSTTLAPGITSTVDTTHDELRLQYQNHDQEKAQDHQILRRDLTRLFHLANDFQIGIALGGGGARALAHIGVLAALEENDIYFDRISGTSGGAIVAAFYAAGFDSEHMLKLFEIGIKPPRWVKYIPQGNKWYLLAMFRSGLIEKRFHKVFGKNTCFEQLLLPTHIISTDLISGEETVRVSGNVADSVVESINHPLLGRPIFRNGEALIDGGILNNVPSSVLRNNSVDYVISVNIGSKLRKSFAKNDGNTTQSNMKKVGFISTLFRVLEVGQNGLENAYENNSDFLILPDTSEYQFEDFTKDVELVKLGYQATLEVMPELKASYLEFVEAG